MRNKKLNHHYDARFDVLYISVEPNESARGYEENEGIIIRRSVKTGEFVGITIFDFKARLTVNDFPGVLDYIERDFLNKVHENISVN